MRKTVFALWVSVVGAMSLPAHVVRASSDGGLVLDETWASLTSSTSVIGIPTIAQAPGGDVIAVVFMADSPNQIMSVVRIDSDGAIGLIDSVTEPFFSNKADVIVRPDGMIIVASEAGNVVTVRAWGPSGLLIFDTPIPGATGFPDFPAQLAFAGAGIFVSTPADGDMLTTMLDLSGNIVWSEPFNSPKGGLEVPTSIAACGSKVIVGGMGEQGVVLLQYDLGGNLVFDELISGSLGPFFPLGPTFVACGDNGTMAMAANPESTCGVMETLVRLYGSDNAMLWTETFPGNPCEQMSPVGIAVDVNGDVVVGAHGVDDHPLFGRFHVRRFDQDGTLEWARQFDGEGQNEVGYAMAMGVNGAVYLTGVTTLGAQSRDVVTTAWDRDGEMCFSAQWSGPGANNDIPSDVVVHGLGQVTVAAVQSETGVGSSAVFLRYIAPSTPVPAVGVWGLVVITLVCVTMVTLRRLAVSTE